MLSAGLEPFRYRPMQAADFRARLLAPDGVSARQYMAIRPGQGRAWDACAKVLFAASERARLRRPEDFTLAGLMADTGMSRPTLYRYFESVEAIRNCGYDLLRAYDYNRRLGALTPDRGFREALTAYAWLSIDLTLSVLADYRRNLALFQSRDDVFHAGHVAAGKRIAALAERAGLAAPGADPHLFQLPSMALALHVRALFLAGPTTDLRDPRWARAVEYYLDMQHGLLAGQRRQSNIQSD